MALDQAANFVREQVTSAISAGDTTINVADASPFPVPPEGYNIVVWDGAAYVRPDQDPDVEIMRVTDTDTTNDTLTVARGQEGTSDFNHPDTSVVVVAQTAKMIADIASEKISNPVTETVDANGNDVTNVGALDVGEATFTQDDLLDGEQHRLIDANEKRITSVSAYNVVSTTSEEIVEVSGNSGLILVWVYGESSESESTAFADLLTFSFRIFSETVIASEERGTPAGRTYDTSNNDGSLTLTMDSDEYNVSVTTIGSGGIF